jgi:hypothetical protein
MERQVSSGIVIPAGVRHRAASSEKLAIC